MAQVQFRERGRNNYRRAFLGLMSAREGVGLLIAMFARILNRLFDQSMRVSKNVE